MRVLVIEDNPTIARSIKKGLEQKSFAVDVAYDGEEGYNAAESEEYDLIILDIMLPSLNGMEIAQKLRAGSNHSRILMLSARDQVEDRIEGLNTGADDYLVKPFSYGELLARVQALLRRPYQGLDGVLEADTLTLNTATNEVYRDSKLIELSTKEYALLEYLLRNKDIVVSKNSIIRHVWDFDADILPHTIEVLVARLRTKIDQPFSGRCLIKTVRGFGYKISDVT